MSETKSRRPYRLTCKSRSGKVNRTIVFVSTDLTIGHYSTDVLGTYSNLHLVLSIGSDSVLNYLLMTSAPHPVP